MVTKYTEEQLYQFKDAGAVPKDADLSSFVKMVEDTKIALAALTEHDGTGRRRSSVSHHRPNFRKHKNKDVVKPDADGWITAAPVKKKSFSTEAESERETFKETFIKARPNNKNIGSSKPADPREIADKPTKTFNAFDALVSDEEVDQDDDDDEEDDDEDDE